MPTIAGGHIKRAKQALRLEKAHKGLGYALIATVRLYAVCDSHPACNDIAGSIEAAGSVEKQKRAGGISAFRREVDIHGLHSC